MEIIRKIKEAETQAKEIIENARHKAVKDSEVAKKEFADAMVKAEQDRKAAIEQAVHKAQAEANEEISKLNKDADRYCSELEQKTQSKINSTAEKVINLIKGL